MPPRRSWATMLAFLRAHLPLLVKGDICTAAQSFDTHRQMPARFNPAGSGSSRQGIAVLTFNHLSEYHVGLKSSG